MRQLHLFFAFYFDVRLYTQAFAYDDKALAIARSLAAGRDCLLILYHCTCTPVSLHPHCWRQALTYDM